MMFKRMLLILNIVVIVGIYTATTVFIGAWIGEADGYKRGYDAALMNLSESHRRVTAKMKAEGF